MTLYDAQLKRLSEKVNSQFQKRHTNLWGVVVSVDGSIRPINEPNKVWIAEYGSSHSRMSVWCYINVVENLPVNLEPDPNPPYLRVKDVYSGNNLPGNSDSHAFNAPIHAVTHENYGPGYTGSDPITIYNPALFMLRTDVRSNSQIRVNLYTYIYQNRRRIFPGINIDITSIPVTNGFKRNVLFYLNVDTNAIEYTLCPEVVNSSSFNAPLVDFPNNVIPSSYITITNPLSTTQAACIDCRWFLQSIPSVSSSVVQAFNWVFDTNLDREDFLDVLPEEVNCLSFVLEDNSIWILLDDDPITWEQLNAGSSGSTTPFNWVFDTNAEREALASADPEEVNLLSLVIEDYSVWILSDDDPITWEPITGGTSTDLSLIVETGSFTAEVNKAYYVYVDSLSSATIDFPASPVDGDFVILVFSTISRIANTITLEDSSHSIAGYSTLSFPAVGGEYRFVYNSFFELWEVNASNPPVVEFINTNGDFLPNCFYKVETTSANRTFNLPDNAYPIPGSTIKFIPVYAATYEYTIHSETQINFGGSLVSDVVFDDTMHGFVYLLVSDLDQDSWSIYRIGEQL